MRGILAIYKREMSSYFASPIAYIVIGFFLFISGLLFYGNLSSAMQYQMQAAMQAARFGGPPEIDVPSIVLRGFLGLMSTFSLFMIPMLTMGVYAEERKRGTMEMLLTSPLTEWQIVAGKYMASLSLYAVMIAPTLIYHLIMGRYSDPGMPWSVMWTGYLGVLLLGAVLVSISTFISSLTESQIVAGIVSFVVILLLWVIDWSVRGAGTTTGEVLQYLSIIRHYEDFSRGVIDTTSIVYYLSLIGLGMFLTLRTLDSMRWRRA